MLYLKFLTYSFSLSVGKPQHDLKTVLESTTHAPYKLRTTQIFSETEIL